MTANIIVSGTFEEVDRNKLSNYFIDLLSEHDGDIDVTIVINRNVEKVVHAVRNLGINFSLIGVHGHTGKKLQEICRFVFKSTQVLEDFVAAYTDEILVLGGESSHVCLDNVLKITPNKKIVFM